MKIGVMDSGIGGIKVLEEIERNFCGHDFVYAFDKTGLPYGNKSREEIEERVFRVCDFLLSKNVDVIIIACNTASCVALDDCKNMYNVPVFGLIPPIKSLSNLSYKKILVLTTSLTAKMLYSKYNHDTNKNIIIAPQINLASIIEKNLNNKRVINDYIENEMTKYIGCDCVFLGCTHYYYIKNRLASFLNVDVLDGRKELICNLKQFINIAVKKNSYTEFYYL